MKDSSSLLFLSLAVVLGLSLAVSGQPSQIAYATGRDAGHDAANRRITYPQTLSVELSAVGNTNSNYCSVIDLPDFIDRLPEALAIALLGAFLTFLGIALDRRHGSVRRHR